MAAWLMSAENERRGLFLKRPAAGHGNRRASKSRSEIAWRSSPLFGASRSVKLSLIRSVSRAAMKSANSRSKYACTASFDRCRRRRRGRGALVRLLKRAWRSPQHGRRAAAFKYQLILIILWHPSGSRAAPRARSARRRNWAIKPYVLAA